MKNDNEDYHTDGQSDACRDQIETSAGVCKVCHGSGWVQDSYPDILGNVHYLRSCSQCPACCEMTTPAYITAEQAREIVREVRDQLFMHIETRIVDVLKEQADMVEETAKAVAREIAREEATAAWSYNGKAMREIAEDAVLERERYLRSDKYVEKMICNVRDIAREEAEKLFVEKYETPEKEVSRDRGSLEGFSPPASDSGEQEEMKSVARGDAARAWCTDETKNHVMDTSLAEAFADILVRKRLAVRQNKHRDGQVMQNLKDRVSELEGELQKSNELCCEKNRKIAELERACEVYEATHDLNMVSLKEMLRQRVELRGRVAELEGQVAQWSRDYSDLNEQLQLACNLGNDKHEATVDDICEVLHKHIQFYDANGALANDVVIGTIRDVLSLHLKPSPQQPAADERLREMLDGQIHLNQALQMAVHLHCKGEQVDESVEKCPTSARQLNADLVITKAAEEQRDKLVVRVNELERYEGELTACSAILQKVLPIGEVKHIGLLEVAAGIEQLVQRVGELEQHLTFCPLTDEQRKRARALVGMSLLPVPSDHYYRVTIDWINKAGSLLKEICEPEAGDE